MRMLQNSARPRAPGGQKLQPVPYLISRSRIAIDIARSLTMEFATTLTQAPNKRGDHIEKGLTGAMKRCAKRLSGSLECCFY